jgi:alkanesulfonate monooxygenase SsuD/methylene tetrahydromethanopterin reductase-like flavin-dependent oxidoreductase (luciferase family)
MAQMLAHTRTVPVGLGLASTQTRHPAMLAMELAGLARMYPGRTRATIGLGNAHWLRQMGIMPDRPLSAVLADLAALRALLNGETVTTAGGAGHSFDDVTLSFPPAEVPPLLIGAVNERALRAAGAHADGVLLSVLAGPTYVRWAAEHVRAGADSVGRPTPPITAFVLASVDDRQDRAEAAVADAVQFFARAELETALVRESSAPQREAILADPWDAATRSRLVGEFAAAGSAEDVAAKLQSVIDHGADSVALWVFPSDDLDEQLHRVAEGVLPLVRRRVATG